ncbi:MAG TPA: Uma2 family endonuclease [Candidatus Acidoferrum sp.]|nr:Uma2 family endonuclease [Candidatus Acidoferrum sp.]
MTAAVLEIPEVRQRLSPLTVEEYHRLDEYNERGRRTELIRGLVIEKMSKSPLHRVITSRLYRLLLPQVPKGLSLWMEQPLTFQDSEPEPDISITRGEEGDYKTKHPASALLVVEVAVTSPALDRANASLYAEAGVAEYWIVLAAERRVEVYRRPEGGHYQEMQVRGTDEPLECASLPGVRVNLSELLA